jgi:putative lipoic acid-binding regulatory protein
MAKNKEITIQIGRTYNVGNYESVRLDVGIKATDKTQEEIMEEVLELANFVKDAIGVK